MSRSSSTEVFLGKGVLKICSKFIGEKTMRSMISINMQGNVIETTLQHGCASVNLLYIYSTPLNKKLSRGLFLCVCTSSFFWRYFQSSNSIWALIRKKTLKSKQPYQVYIRFSPKIFAKFLSSLRVFFWHRIKQ